MTLLGELETATAPRVQSCKAKIVLDALSSEERALAEYRRPDGSYPISGQHLAAILHANSIDVSSNALNKHRAGVCPCRS